MSGKKVNLLRVVVVLLIPVLLSTVIVMAVYAKYTVSSAPASDGARVASFSVSVGDVITVPLTDLKPGDAIEINVTVTLDTEVKTQCALLADTLGNLPLTVSVSDPCVYAPGAHTYYGKITVAWPADEKNVQYAGLVDLLTVTVEAEQID